MSLRAAAASDGHGQDWLHISVTVEGVGMSAEVLAHLFNPFFTTKVIGTGLGLISCKRIIEGAQGSIRVVSTPGVGSPLE
ncbi:ATP-binding protein, partial [Stenotrophomonas sp. SrG]|uniref:ATP-binding protein n=1 Tax=Stenotrophomonas sp. SrG TaxID=3414430 RepID=UPI003CF1228A